MIIIFLLKSILWVVVRHGMVCDPAEYKESQNMRVWLRKLVLAQHNFTVCSGAGERRSQAVTPTQKSAINWT